MFYDVENEHVNRFPKILERYLNDIKQERTDSPEKEIHVKLLLLEAKLDAIREMVNSLLVSKQNYYHHK